MQIPASTTEWISHHYTSRRAKNPGFSLRAYAKLLHLPPGRLSEFLASKRKLSAAMAKKVAERLSLSPTEQAAFCQLAALERSGVEQQVVLHPSAQGAEFQSLEENEFRLIADWYHFAILSLMRTDDFQPNHRWIARRLGISAIEASAAVSRLVKLGYIKILHKTKWERISNPLTTTHNVPSVALRRSHKQSLEQAISALEELDVTERDITSIYIPTSKEKLQLAKEMIRTFRRQLAEALQDGAKEEVFTLNVQFLPISKRSSK